MHKRILRTIDANINRVSEGLRVLEDIARFIIEDARISRQLKTMRHMLNQLDEETGWQLLNNRDAVGDIGAESDLKNNHKDIASLVRANSKRVQEGLRVLEEMSKLPDVKEFLPNTKLKEFRYLAYSIEKCLIDQLSNNKAGDGGIDERTKNKR